MVYLFLLAIPIVGLLVIRAFYRDFAGLGEWLWFQDEYDAISQSIDQFGQSSYLYIQAIHIIGVVVWFAGLFYIGRLFVYHKEASRRPEPERKILEEQFTIMERRLWYAITWPGLCITVLRCRNWNRAKLATGIRVALLFVGVSPSLVRNTADHGQ